MIWCACERIGVKPPGVADKWDDCDPVTQARILAFEQVRNYDEYGNMGPMEVKK